MHSMISKAFSCWPYLLKRMALYLTADQQESCTWGNKLKYIMYKHLLLVATYMYTYVGTVHAGGKVSASGQVF